MRDMGRGAGSAGRRVVSRRRLRPVSAAVIMIGGHSLKAWTKKQQVVALSSADSELYAAVKIASEGLGVQSVAEDLGISCGLTLHLDASATMCRSTSTCRICR